jgi:regulator of protease activity HflC (stomatin/prohibitin superfamily)
MMLAKSGDVAGPDGMQGYRLRTADKVIAVGLFLGLISLLLWPFVFFVIRPGEVGVVYHLLTGGTETNYVYGEGLGVKLPWNRIYRYDVRTQARDYRVRALAQDGLAVDVSITVLFRPFASKVGRLHKEVGPNYADVLVRPLSIEAVRDVVGKMSPHDLYRVDVNEVESKAFENLSSGPHDLINYQSVTLLELKLPEALNAAITRKLTEQQRTATYDHLIAQAQKEAERKRVEAIGIQTFYSIVGNALSPQLLTWRGIEATVDIARSNNAKVVIVGGGRDQLPLILGSDIAKQPDLPTPTPVEPNSHPLPSFDDLPKLFPDGTAGLHPGPGLDVAPGQRSLLRASPSVASPVPAQAPQPAASPPVMDKTQPSRKAGPTSPASPQ